MRVLMLSGDPRILDARSDVALRMKEYGALLDRLDIFVLAARARDCATPALALSQSVSAEAVTGRMLRFRRAYVRSAHLLSRERYDVITAQDIEHAVIAWALARRFNIPWQMQIHADIMSPRFARHSALNRLRVFAARFLLPRATCVRVVSYRIARSIKAYRDAVILPVFVDTDAIRKAPVSADLRKKYEAYDKVILMASRLTREKNFALALCAMKRVIEAHPKALLVIAGSGSEKRAIIRAATQMGIAENVALEGNITSATLFSYYKTADVYLLTSDYEGYGRTLIEAAAAGCPIVSTDVGIADEIKGAYMVPMGDEKAIADALLRQLALPRVAPQLPPMLGRRDYLERWVNALRACR